MEDGFLFGFIVESLGWGYSLAWSLSFYGQIVENYRLKSVQGMNLDFAALNVNGFIFYFIYTLYGFTVQSSSTGNVEAADLLFSGHALAATIFTAIQIFIYPRKTNTIRPITIIFLGGLWALTIVAFFFSFFYSTTTTSSLREGVIVMMGWFKLICTLLKYMPQIWWNYKRKSTEGWSIFNVMMDLTGGIFSVSQSILRVIFQPSYHFNIVKVLLGALTILYDAVFVLQHFIFYRLQRKSRYQIPQSSVLAIQTISPPSNQLQYNNKMNRFDIQTQEDEK